MESNKTWVTFVFVLGLMVCTANVSEAAPMGTAWTYQGRLMDTSVPADGPYDLQFRLFDDPCTGTQQGSTIDFNDLDVIDGHFTVELDFGSDVFNGDARWLETTVAQADGSDPCTLRPRIEIAAVPYALQTRGIFVDDLPPYIDDIWSAKETTRKWMSVAMSADGTIQTAVVIGGQIYVSADSGDSWTAKELNRNWRSVAMSADGTIQTAVVENGLIYVSTDSGNTWTAKVLNRKWWSVAMSADGTKQTAVVWDGQVYVSTDSGNTWSAKETSRSWSSVAMSADGTKQTAVVYPGQIYVSRDSGNTWTAKESNRYWYSVAMSADGTIQTAVVRSGQIHLSTDSGNTWTAKEWYRDWLSVAMSADGTKQTAVFFGGQIYVSTDSGNSWTAKESNRMWDSVAMSADGTIQTAVVESGRIYIGRGEFNDFKVGIGTSGPAAKLDVSGGIRGAAKTDSTFLSNALPIPDEVAYGLNAAYSTDGGGMFAWYQGVPDHTDLAIWYGDDQNADLRFLRGQWNGTHQDLTDVMTLSANGNIGIGTMYPNEKLDVRGDIAFLDNNGTKGFRIQLREDGVFGNGGSPDFNIRTFRTQVNAFSIDEDTGNVAIRYSDPGSAALAVSGNVGIGTNAPTAKLEVKGDIKVSGNVGIGTSEPKQSLHNAGDYYGKGHIWLHAAEGDGSSGTVYIQARDDSGTSTISTQFRTQSSGSLVNVMYLSPTGNVGIGTASPSSKLHVSGGCITGSMCSDIRLKKNIEPLPDGSILDRVLGLEAVTFEWKDRVDGKRQIGLIAQDVEEVFPEVVTTPDDGTCEKGLLAIGVDAVLVEAIKELKIENELLKDRIEALEGIIEKHIFAVAKEVQ